jgi:hypothetical protein
MTYRVVYGAALVHAIGDGSDKRAREILEQDDGHAVAICDASGNVLGGVRLQLKLGFCSD